MQGEDPIHVVELVRASGSSKLDAVIYDEAHGSEQSVEHLLQLGHRCIGLLVGPPRLGSTRQRVDGALRAVDKRGLDRSTLAIRHAEHTVDGGGRALRMLLEGNRTITGGYAAGEQLALGAALGAVAAGVHIPADVSLVGLGHPSWGDLMRPRLTSYTLPLEELAMTAALLMVSRVVKEQNTISRAGPDYFGRADEHRAVHRASGVLTLVACRFRNRECGRLWSRRILLAHDGTEQHGRR